MLGWRLLPARLPGKPDRGRISLHDLTTYRGALVAVGATDDGALGMIWSSTDGEVWKSIAGSTPLEGLLFRSVAVGEPGIVVLGWAETDDVAMFSPDGIAWTRQPLPGSRGQPLLAAAWRAGRYVAVGGGVGGPGTAASWTSEDGRTWTPVSIIGSGTQALLTSVAAGPDGFVVDGMEGGHASIWTSPDGKAWQRSDLPGTPIDEPGRLRYAGGHFLFPVDGGGLWTSPDGQRWSHTTVPGFGVGVFDVAAIPGGFVAVGRSSGETGAVAVAHADLTGWTLLPTDPVFSEALVSSIAVSPDGSNLVGVGLGGVDGEVFLLADPARLVDP